MTTERLPDLSQVQSNVLRGFRTHDMLPILRYVFLRFADTRAAQAWLGQTQGEVTYCTDWDRLAAARKGGDDSAQFIWNVGFTYGGMRKLGVPAEPPPKGTFDPIECQLPEVSPFQDQAAFVQGAAFRGAALLGDEGDSAPDKWDEPFKAGDIDAVVSLAAWDESGMDAARATLATSIKKTRGVTELGAEEGRALPDKPAGTEHFGFVDGIGQPDVAGSGLPSYPGEGAPEKGGWRPIKPGEFVLGYEDETERTLHDTDLLRNGSYLVFRKLHQDVAGFRTYTAEAAKAMGGDATAEWVQAKLIGRWHSGAAMAASPEADDPELGADPERNNDFRYGRDSHGHACPFAAHVRRANPRDAIDGPTPLQVSHHRIIRRGMTYGPPLPDGATKDDGKARGILFVVLNADIQNQFEFVQSNWLNAPLSSRFLTRREDKDSVVGANAGDGKFIIPDKAGPHIAWNLPRFVTVRGAGYFFLPSLAALQSLAAGKGGSGA